MGSLAVTGLCPTHSWDIPCETMERVGWHPVGLYGKKRHRGATFCYTIITIALLAGTVAVVVSWLLATGIIDPDPDTTSYKEGRKLDIFRDLNSLQADIKKVTVAVAVSDTTKNRTDTSTEAAEIQNDESSKLIKKKEEMEPFAELEIVETAILKEIDSEIVRDNITIDAVDDNKGVTETFENVIAVTENDEEVGRENATEVTELPWTVSTKEATEAFSPTEPPAFTTIETTEKPNDPEVTKNVNLVNLLNGQIVTAAPSANKLSTETK